MRIEINHNCADFNSYRAARVKSLFNAESGCNWQHVAELPIEDDDWKIGLIVGASGSGKTSIGKQVFGEAAVYDLYDGWKKDRPIIDCIAPSGDFNQVTGALSAVGLGDVPAWLRPFHVLSNGEKFRAGLARLICERPENSVVDEFTSVIDRQIAKVGAAAFAKSWRKGPGRIILLSCHYDIIEWLQPDWVYDTVEARFSRDCLRRPPVQLDIYKANGTLWHYFKEHYYLDLPHPPAAEYFIGMVGDTPVAHLAVCPMFTANGYRATRLVVMPEWQGIGVGTAFLAAVCQYHLEGHGRCNREYPTFFHTSHPQLCGALRKSKKWVQTSAALYGGNKSRSHNSIRRSHKNSEKSGKIVGSGYGGHFRAVQGFKGLNTLVMIISILGDPATSAYQLAYEATINSGHVINTDCYFAADLAIAPLLTRRLGDRDISWPRHGVLIFHPSPLPHGRGASAIKKAYKRQEIVTAATWFWANIGKMDSGDICEMEVVRIDYTLRPREFYDRHILPAMARTLERALSAISSGYIRRVPQVEEYATFDFKE